MNVLPQVTFVSPDGIWALRFGSTQQYAAFTEAYNNKLFENTFKVDNDETNRNKVSHACFCSLQLGYLCVRQRCAGRRKHYIAEAT